MMGKKKRVFTFLLVISLFAIGFKYDDLGAKTIYKKTNKSTTKIIYKGKKIKSKVEKKYYLKDRKKLKQTITYKYKNNKWNSKTQINYQKNGKKKKRILTKRNGNKYQSIKNYTYNKKGQLKSNKNGKAYYTQKKYYANGKIASYAKYKYTNKGKLKRYYYKKYSDKRKNINNTTAIKITMTEEQKRAWYCRFNYCAVGQTGKGTYESPYYTPYKILYSQQAIPSKYKNKKIKWVNQVLTPINYNSRDKRLTFKTNEKYLQVLKSTNNVTNKTITEYYLYDQTLEVVASAFDSVDYIDIDQYNAESMLARINEYRAGYGLKPFKLDPTINKMAYKRATELYYQEGVMSNPKYSGGDIGHVRPSYASSQTNSTSVQYDPEFKGHNFYIQSELKMPSSIGAFKEYTLRQWVNSPAHNAELTSEKYTHVGIGDYYGSTILLCGYEPN